MPNRHIITAFGTDAPGIVMSITKTLFELGCNIEDSTMSQLRGNFAMMMVIKIPDDASFEQLDSAFNEARKKLGLMVDIKPFTETLFKEKGSLGKKGFMLTLSGGDQPGIVYYVSKTLANMNINISGINTVVLDDANGDTYIMILELEVPFSKDYYSVKSKLMELSGKLNVDITFEPMEEVDL